MVSRSKLWICSWMSHTNHQSNDDCTYCWMWMRTSILLWMRFTRSPGGLYMGYFSPTGPSQPIDLITICFSLRFAHWSKNGKRSAKMILRLQIGYQHILKNVQSVIQPLRKTVDVITWHVESANTNSVGCAWVRKLTFMSIVCFSAHIFPIGPWSEHGTSWYNCNRYDEKSSHEARDSQTQSRASLERYLHVSSMVGFQWVTLFKSPWS